MDQAVDSSLRQNSISKAGVTRQCLLVTGMHRSGTSALTRVLSMLGCELPKTLMGANDFNPRGHWESDAICALNDDLLHIIGRTWRDWGPIENQAFESLPVQAFQGRAQAQLATEFGDAALFVLKDPRIAVLTPFWLDTLEQAGIEAAIVCPVRHPVEVARSLARRDGIDESEGHLIWLRHVLAAEASTRGRARTFATYDQLLHDWRSVVDRISTELAVNWPRGPASRQSEVAEFLACSIRHHAVNGTEARLDPHFSMWTRVVHGVLARWAESGEAAADYGVLDEIRAAFDAAVPAFAGLVSRGRAATARLENLENASATPSPAGMAVVAEPEAAALMERLVAEEAKVRTLRDQLHDLDSRLRQRDEELSQVWPELAVAREGAKRVSDEVDALKARLVDADAWVFRLAGERQTAERNLSLVQAAMDRLTSERDAGQTALRCARTDLGLARMRNDQLETELVAAHKAQTVAREDLHSVVELMTVEAQARAEVLAAERDEALAELNATARRADTAETERAMHASKLNNAHDELAVLARIVTEVQTVADRERAQAECLRSDLAAATNRLEVEAQRAAASAEEAAHERAQVERLQSDLAAASNRLEVEAHRAATSAEEAAWLANVAATLHARVWWWSLLPARFTEMMLHRRLKRRGLFDGDAYLANNPDVAASGHSPIRHYLRHGIFENRARPA